MSGVAIPAAAPPRLAPIRGVLAAASPYLIIVVTAACLWAPSLMIDYGDSLQDNLVWSTQFSRLVAHGVIYPRWLPASFQGLGSPAFEFYPPLPFWITALVSQVSGPWASPMLQLKLAALVGLIASGVTMRLWLRTLCAPPKALLCAVIYMAAPYHLMDHYVRGALAEYFAIAVLPLVALGLGETARGGRFGPPVLALGYGLTLLSHLPLALLTSILLVAPYGLYLLWTTPGERRIAFALKAGVALACGVGMAAIYLAPALSLQPAISSEFLWNIQAAQHLALRPGAWTSPFDPIAAAIAVIEVGFAAVLGWRAWRGGDARPLFWAVLSVGVFAALSGLLPGLWSIPLMAKVQFPWRALAILEFAVVTLAALSPWPTTRGLAVLLGLLAIANPGLTTDLRNLARGQPDAMRVTPAFVDGLLRTSTDSAEYLPHGMLLIEGGHPSARVPLDTLAALPLAAPSLAATSDPLTGAVHLRAAPGAGPIVLRRFYFPSWQVRCDGATVAAAPVGPGRLVGFAAPVGAKSCDAAAAPTAPERVGSWLSLASLALMLSYLVWAAALGARRRQGFTAMPQPAA
ncbi:MAG TPA: hypothetical protein VKQ70_10180 [Caulobacteraceae bacterium]|jgi:hypothetical protein|nr:hypothetical protein [Caulobacteraceae bacterium]